MNVNTLKLGDAGYPEVLRHINNPPKQIYYRGADPDEWLNLPKVAVVGSRKITPYGKAVTEKLVSDLAATGVVIISGLAYGIDAAAHKAALDSGGLAVVVLGTGIDNISPAGNAQLGQAILKNSGTIISEYGPKSYVLPRNFVIRDRIISGLCDVLLIPEATLKSGSLHTARFAMEQGKTVMAVPGNITSPTSEGCNNLIKSGAVPVTNADDVFFALKISPQQQRSLKIFTGTELEEAIYELIKSGVCDQEQLAAGAKVDGRELSSTLTMLEISGHIRPAGAGSWIIS